MNILLRTVGITDLALFSSLFALTFANPDAVEASLRGFVKTTIADELKEKLQESNAVKLADKALRFAGKLGYDEQKLRDDLNENPQEKIVGVIAGMCGYDCEKQKPPTKSIADNYLDRIANFQLAGKSLGEIVKDKYLDIVDRLRTDLRIFSGSKAVMFLVLVSISFLKPKAAAQLFLPSVLLLVSTVKAASIYFFGENWFHTLVFNRYIGYG